MGDDGIHTPPASAGVLRLILDALDEAKAEDIRQLDVRKLTDITDFMVNVEHMFLHRTIFGCFPIGRIFWNIISTKQA